MALIIGLILLLVITMLSLGGVRGISTQERMASNLRDRNLAFQAAETALRDGEAALMADLAVVGPRVAAHWSAAQWEACWEGTECGPPKVAALSDEERRAWGLAQAPTYRIERLGATVHGSLAADEALSSAPLYRITARAVGGTADSVVILQTTYMP